jgi:hypothetical protein
MTNDEAQREFLEIFILSAIISAKVKKLANSRIKTSGQLSAEYIAGQKVVNKLCMPEFMNSINLILENNQALLEENSALFFEILGRNLIVDGRFSPIERRLFREALTITI